MVEKVKGWFISGSHPYHYEMGTDQINIHQGRASGYLKSTTVQEQEEFATMMQQFKADKYRGKGLSSRGLFKPRMCNNSQVCG